MNTRDIIGTVFVIKIEPSFCDFVPLNIASPDPAQAGATCTGMPFKYFLDIYAYVKLYFFLFSHNYKAI
jgi:hypothetical protein